MARQKCRNLQVFRGDYEKYKIYSNQLYNLLLEYTDMIERFSIDECFLDMTHYLMGRDILDIAKEINLRVKKELGFTVNIGISTNKLLAKMASDFEKPDKIHTLYPDEIPQKMWPLPVKDLLFLGRKTAPKLFNMRIKTIGDLAHFNKDILIKKFGKMGNQMWEYANRH
jgi:DNA polymerase-4